MEKVVETVTLAAMKVLMISGDLHILTPGSGAFARAAVQRASVEQLDVFVWPRIHSGQEILRAAGRTSYDVITAQDPFWRGLLAWRVARRTGAKLNIQVHTDLSAQSFWRRALARFVLRRADSVRVVSAKIRDTLAPLFLRAPVTVLPVFIDLGPFRNLSRHPHSRLKKVILWVGRFEAEKDPLRALSVLKDVRADGIDAGLIMLGSGRLEETLRRHTKELGSSVEFPGWHSPLEYLEMADVVLSTSQHESFGVSMLEALAAGVPVVAPDVGIAKEAGAIIVSRSDLSSAVTHVLKSSMRGELKLTLPTQEEWTKKWRESLI